MGTISRLKQWVMKPFSSDMDVLGWFLFAGLILCVTFLWLQILNRIEE